jgi:uncharacterized repeat protein (TIGR04052 family)
MKGRNAMRFMQLALTGLAISLGACAHDNSAVPPAQAVEISFALVHGDQPVSCGQTMANLGKDHTSARLRDARFYVQDIALIGPSGALIPVTLAKTDWQTDAAPAGDVALLDFETGRDGCVGTPSTNTTLIGTVPEGRYVGLSFVVGVPESLNHTSVETAPPPLDSAALGWSWQAGRKFIKVEVDPDGGVQKPDRSTASTWFFHLGSTDCSGNPTIDNDVTCNRPNRVTVTFAAFNPSSQAIALDLDRLFSQSVISADQGQAVGCMSGPTDPDCFALFKQLGLSLPTGQTAPAAAPPAFRLVPLR